ncbi:MAG: hypothetical protein ACR2QC_06535 [Gammaproteobacteria bacterium]
MQIHSGLHCSSFAARNNRTICRRFASSSGGASFISAFLNAVSATSNAAAQAVREYGFGGQKSRFSLFSTPVK